MKIRVSSSHIMISSLLSSWSYSLINLALIDRSLFIDRFSQLPWESRYSRYSRIKLFSDRGRFAKPYSAYSISSALTILYFVENFDVQSRWNYASILINHISSPERFFLMNLDFYNHFLTTDYNDFFLLNVDNYFFESQNVILNKHIRLQFFHEMHFFMNFDHSDWVILARKINWKIHVFFNFMNIRIYISHCQECRH
jgi:hypothetical protein